MSELTLLDALTKIGTQTATFVRTARSAYNLQQTKVHEPLELAASSEAVYRCLRQTIGVQAELLRLHIDHVVDLLDSYKQIDP